MTVVKPLVVTAGALQADGWIVCGGRVLMESDPTIYYAILARFWQ
jgi:hypothetical protein